MATVDNNGTAYATTQEQGQLASIQQFCLAIAQQPPSNIYAPAQQQCISTNSCSIRNDGVHGGSGFSCGNSGGGFPQQPTIFGISSIGAYPSTCPPTPYKRWENLNYCHTHGGNVNNTNTSARCMIPGPMHKSNASRTNIIGQLISGLHKTILPLACSRTLPKNCCPQQQQLAQQHLPITYHPTQGTTWQHATHPAQFGKIPPAGGTYH
jgi:hypothetical protein